MAEGLRVGGLKALFPKKASAGDPAISLGQARVAALTEEN